MPDAEDPPEIYKTDGIKMLTLPSFWFGRLDWEWSFIHSILSIRRQGDTTE